MAKKTENCLNCGKSLSKDFEYCPYCGQKNANHNISFAQLTGDFFSNYFTLDSRFFRSIPPFLFRPGALTLRFNEGKRQSYANPVRLYIIVSFIYFFILSFMASDLSEGVRAAPPDQLEPGDSLTVSDEDSNKVKLEAIENEEGKKEYVIETQSGNSITIDTTDGWPLNAEQWELLLSKEASAYSSQELFDSLHVEDRPDFDQHLVRQMIKVKKTDKEYLFAFIIKNLSFMMFLMLPLFALILKLLYVRRKILYIQHLVHTLHIHSFAFLIYSLSLSISLWLVDNELGWKLAVLIVTVYCFLSFKKVYQQGFRKTLLKFLLTGGLYSCLLFFAFVVELFLSFLFF